MNGWEDILGLITNPYFIGLVVITLAIEPIVKYMRRFYPESHKEAIKKVESFNEQLLNNKEDLKVYKRANLKIGLFIFGPTILLFTIYILYSLLIGIDLKPACIKGELAKFSTISIIILGLYAINSDKFNRFLFKDDYQKVMELTYKQNGGKEFIKKYEKLFVVSGYFLLVMGIIAAINLFFL